MSRSTRFRCLSIGLFLTLSSCQAGASTTLVSQEPRGPETAATGDGGDGEAPSSQVAATFDKREVEIPMRDGVTLFTTIYTPKTRERALPMLMIRTPYSVGPYGEDVFPDRLGPSDSMMNEGYIFVYQDVRGRFMSGGAFVNMTPHEGPLETNESTDTYDTVEWLVQNIEGHNGRVGQWGISYPGFYAAAGMIAHHPALVAVSPQAPIADWWYDDFHHHGAFFLPHAFNFLAVFGRPRTGPTKKWGPRFDHKTKDGFQFFLDLGPLENARTRYLGQDNAFWNSLVAHPNYDKFWRDRDILPHLSDVAPAVMTVGGWFDAEDLYGPLKIYEAVEKKNPDVFNMLVMGPWRHGGWSRTDGDHLGDVSFGAKTSRFYQEEVERRFFGHFLRGEGELDLPEALVFETGSNEWRSFDAWPPPTAAPAAMYFGGDGTLVDALPTQRKARDRFVSDPDSPVPFTEDVATGMTREYMTDDQRFASRRPDVMTYRSAPLEKGMTLAGPIEAELWVTTDHEDADWIVKLIDVFPDDAKDHEFLSEGQHMSGYQMMVRSEVLRGRFRNSPASPEPFKPGQPTRVTVELQDVLHRFEPGHRIMVQVQSTWFPLVDRNPQRWVDNIFEATKDDFEAANHEVLRESAHPSALRFSTVPEQSASPP